MPPTFESPRQAVAYYSAALDNIEAKIIKLAQERSVISETLAHNRRLLASQQQKKGNGGENGCDID